MAKEKDPKDKIKPFSSISGGKKPTKDKRKPHHQIYVTDAQFKNAMDLIREDMNKALNLSSMLNTQYYFLTKFLVQKGLINEEEFSSFLQEELTKLNKKGDQ